MNNKALKTVFYFWLSFIALSSYGMLAGYVAARYSNWLGLVFLVPLMMGVSYYLYKQESSNEKGS